MALRLNELGFVAITLMIVSGCAAGTNRSGNEMTPERAERLVRVALTDIQDLYIEELALSKLAIAGLQRVAADTPPAELGVTDGEVVVSFEQIELHRIVMSEPSDAEFWGSQTAFALGRLQEAFPVEAAPSLSDLSNSFMSGVVDALDEGSKYNSPEGRLARAKRLARGRGTLNVGIKREGTDWQVSRVFSTALADSGELRTGDRILTVDDAPVRGLEAQEVLTLFSGDLNSPITLTILRAETQQTLKVELRREQPGVNSVGASPDGKTLEITVTHFTVYSPRELESVLMQVSLKRSNEYKGIIVDLRGNQGGLLEASVKVADLMIEDGRILSIHGRHPNSHQYYSADGRDLANGLPLLVLVDADTAAAAEFVTAALQDLGRAIVVGMATYGRGSVQTLVRLPNNGEVSVTWGSMSTSNGYQLKGRGVLPTVCTGGDATVDSVLAPLRTGHGIIDRATRTREIDSNDETALEAHRGLCPPRSDGEDISLEVAKAILEEPGLYERILKLDQGSQAAAVH